MNIDIAKIPKKAANWYFTNMPILPVCVISKFRIGLLIIDWVPLKPTNKIDTQVYTPSKMDPSALMYAFVLIFKFV